MTRAPKETGWGPFPPLLPSPKRVLQLLLIKVCREVECVASVVADLTALRLEQADGALGDVEQAVSDRLELALRGGTASPSASLPEQDLAYDPVAEPEVDSRSTVASLDEWRRRRRVAGH